MREEEDDVHAEMHAVRAVLARIETALAALRRAAETAAAAARRGKERAAAAATRATSEASNRAVAAQRAIERVRRGGAVWAAHVRLE